MKIEFDVGDTVICKKSFNIKKTDISFTKNEIYKIEYVSYWDEEKKINMYQIGNWSFISTTEIHNLHLPEFEDCFYTKQEIRKMKLNNIENERD